MRGSQSGKASLCATTTTHALAPLPPPPRSIATTHAPCRRPLALLPPPTQPNPPLPRVDSRPLEEVYPLPRSPPPQAFDSQSLEELDGSRKARFPMKTIPAHGFPKIDVDRRLLSLIYRNAISNACKVRRRSNSTTCP
jgi:hypothetical protein